MELNYEAMQAAAERAAKESAQAFNDYMVAIGTRRQRIAEETQEALDIMAHDLDDSRREEMESQIEEETAKAAESIRAKYEKNHPAAWNEGENAKAWREFSERF